ncbi:type II toxin-antitoxin system VapC family toxin [Scytonema sp. NUACC26]|uniref:type II toxin-antitoxin system VapC family toxin n=1 Tax=Scytonema sp. NUACC26 TaxID=3140176 RepID=UPI0034DBAD1F
MKKALLDTNILSYFLRGKIEVVTKLNEYSQFYEYLTFSILSYYEIKSGLLYKDAKNLLSKFEELANESEILPLTVKTMNIASKIYVELRTKGLLIPPIDILIAASSIEYGYLLVTANTKHFENISDLTLENWAE